MRSRVALVGQWLQQRQQWLVTAESCTGGLIAQWLTELPGSSAWFAGGWVTYANYAKQQWLGVNAELLAEQGAVSEAVVSAMCQGAIHHSQAHWSVAVSGIAGPGGGSDHKPVGLVWIGIQGPKTAHCQCYHFEGNRQQIRQQAAQQALTNLYQLLMRY